MGRDSSFILKTNHLSHIYICKIVFSRFVAFLFFFFKLLFHEWNICISWLSGFRFLSIISFFQKVTSAGNVSGCKLTGSVKIILLLVMLDSSSLSYVMLLLYHSYFRHEDSEYLMTFKHLRPLS